MSSALAPNRRTEADGTKSAIAHSSRGNALRRSCNGMTPLAREELKQMSTTACVSRRHTAGRARRSRRTSGRRRSNCARHRAFRRLSQKRSVHRRFSVTLQPSSAGSLAAPHETGISGFVAKFRIVIGRRVACFDSAYAFFRNYAPCYAVCPGCQRRARLPERAVGVRGTGTMARQQRKAPAQGQPLRGSAMARYPNIPREVLPSGMRYSGRFSGSAAIAPRTARRTERNARARETNDKRRGMRKR